MGGAASGPPRIRPYVDSPTLSGLKTCVSDPLDAFCTRDEFVHELLDMLREPVSTFDMPCLKEVQVDFHGPAECTVKVVLDGAALQELDSPEKNESGKDVTRVWLRLTWDLTKWEMVLHSHEPSTGKVHTSIRISFLKDPFRIEALFIMNQYQTDEPSLAYMAEAFWLHPVLHEFGIRKTKLRRNVESPYGNGSHVTISEPLDGQIDFETLWKGFLSYIKKNCIRCEMVSDSQFEVTIIDPYHGGIDRKPLIRLIKHDESTGEIVDVASVDNLRLIDTRHVKIHREPLRVEHWTEAGGKRIYKRLNSELLQRLLDAIVSERSKDGKPDGQVAEAQGCAVM